MLENLEISQKLYSLRRQIIDNDDLLLIDKMIDKYKSKIIVDIEYTNRAMLASNSVLRNIANRIYQDPECWDMPDINDYSTWTLNEELFDKLELLDKEREILINKYSLLRIKNKKNKNQLSKQNSVLIENVFIEELNELIKKYKL